MQTSIIYGTVTRPANTTAYVAGQVVGSTFTFSPLGGGLGLGGQILSAQVNTSQAAATPPDLELWLFTAPLATPPTDASTFAPAAADMNAFAGIIPIATGNFKKTSNRQACMSASVNLPVPGNLFGVLVVRNAYAPVSGEVINIGLSVLRSYAY